MPYCVNIERGNIPQALVVMLVVVPATATAHECRVQSYYPGPGGKPVRGQTVGAQVTGDTEKQLLSVAPGATRFGKPEKTVEPNHSRRRRQGTGSSPGVS
ncbi:hypothetical protein ACFLV6_02820 [Chloroflexota bacterium]